MNMDELLKNIWPVDEVPQTREMTLEEFLQRAGVLREDAHVSGTTDLFCFNLPFQTPNRNNGLFDFPKQANVALTTHARAMRLADPYLVQAGGITISDGLARKRGMRVSDGTVKTSVETILPISPPVPYAFARGRRCGGSFERVVERRQRRMIKNRESAARSRARKQAYTLELEAEIAKLKEVNEELQKKQEKLMVLQKNHQEKVNPHWGAKRQCLRRTLTGPW